MTESGSGQTGEPDRAAGGGEEGGLGQVVGPGNAGSDAAVAGNGAVGDRQLGRPDRAAEDGEAAKKGSLDHVAGPGNASSDGTVADDGAGGDISQPETPNRAANDGDAAEKGSVGHVAGPSAGSDEVVADTGPADSSDRPERPDQATKDGEAAGEGGPDHVAVPSNAVSNGEVADTGAIGDSSQSGGPDRATSDGEPAEETGPEHVAGPGNTGSAGAVAENAKAGKVGRVAGMDAPVTDEPAAHAEAVSERDTVREGNAGEGGEVAGHGEVATAVAAVGGGTAVESEAPTPEVVAGEARGGVDGAGVDGALHVGGRGELLPLLWSESSERGLGDVPHWPVAGGRLHLALAVVATTPRGEVGVFHVSYQQVGEFSFDVLMAEACVHLSAGLRVEERDTPDGQLLSVSGTLVAAAACLPAFYQRVSQIAGAERLVVGLPSPDEILVAPADSELVDVVHRAVQESAYPAAELVPSVLSVESDRVEVLAERG